MPELPVPALADDVVRLRPWREADIPAQLEAFRDPHFQRFSDWEPRTEAAALAYLAAHEQARRRGEQIELALVDEDVLLGGVSLNNVDLRQGRAEVGYWLAPHARGRGVATHAVRLITGWAFEVLGIARLELTCGPDNVASQRVAERCGFTREGVMHSHLPFKGGRRDTVLFRLLNDVHPRGSSMELKDCKVGSLMAVSDLDAARRFYEDQLGLVPAADEENGARYFCAEGTSLFVYVQPDNAGTSSATLAGWTVDDLDQIMETLGSRGVHFERYDQPGLATDERGVFAGPGFRAAWIKDPDGNTMAITEFAR